MNNEEQITRDIVSQIVSNVDTINITFQNVLLTPSTETITIREQIMTLMHTYNRVTKLALNPEIHTVEKVDILKNYTEQLLLKIENIKTDISPEDMQSQIIDFVATFDTCLDKMDEIVKIRKRLKDEIWAQKSKCEHRRLF